MSELRDFVLTEATEDKLWAHAIALDDALAILDGEYKTFMNPRDSRRRLLIGVDRSQRLLMLVVEPTTETSVALLITGWPSSASEARRFSQPGGTRYG